MRYYQPTKIVLGRLELEIRKEVETFQPRKILLITGKRAMKEAGVTDKLLNCLKGFQVTVFDKVKPNPSPEIVKEAQQETDLVIGLGGGSALDVAKVIATNLKKPCIAIPTTAGSGSEVTPFAALYDWEKKKKISLKVKFPEVALVDWQLTSILSPLSPWLVAVTGMDALSHAIESCWSIHSTPLSDTHAKRAIELIIENLRESWKKTSVTAREKMSLAALEAGMAISQTKTTAVHSVSYPLTLHCDFPHGWACGLTLPHFLTYNYQVSEGDCLDKRGAKFVKKRIKEIAAFLGASDVEEAKETILNLMESVDMGTTGFDIDDTDTELVIREGFSPERVKNNPRRLTEEGLRGILDKIRDPRYLKSKA